jgi:SAM domain (Sterile alpha motif)
VTRENDIDVSVLGHLTDRDLKEMGVSLGHRRKLLERTAQIRSKLKLHTFAPRFARRLIG